MSRRALVLLVLLSACRRDPYLHEYATTRPAARDLVGTYRPGPESRLPVAINRGIELTLLDDGRFILQNLPNCWFVESERDCLPGTQHVIGTWR